MNRNRIFIFQSLVRINLMKKILSIHPKAKTKTTPTIAMTVRRVCKKKYNSESINKYICIKTHYK